MQHLSHDELLRLLAAARNHSEMEYLAILVGYWHGLRVSEITGPKGFTPEAVRDDYITIQRLKGSLKTTQPLVRHENPLLNERDQIIALVANSEPGKPVFHYTRHRFWMIMRRHCKTAGIAEHKAFPHILKHSIAMQTIQGAGIENVRAYLGHKSIGSTGAYLKVDDDAASRAITGAQAVLSREHSPSAQASAAQAVPLAPGAETPCEQSSRRESARSAAQARRWAKAVKTFATFEDLGTSLAEPPKRGYGVQSLKSASKKPLAGRARATAK